MLRKIWRFHGGNYEEYRLLGYKTLFLPHRKHIISPLDSLAQLCKIEGFHGGDYKEFRLLGYKTPVLTSQETHNISATEPSRLILCKIRGFHGGDY
jgi:hypothetical protein